MCVACSAINIVHVSYVEDGPTTVNVSWTRNEYATDDESVVVELENKTYGKRCRPQDKVYVHVQYIVVLATAVITAKSTT